MASVSGKEVISFFKNADLELAELVLEFGQTAVEARVEARAKISANLKKARAARKPAGSASSAPAATETAHVAHAQPSPLTEARGRQHNRDRERIPAPAHTAAATSVESDQALS